MRIGKWKIVTAMPMRRPGGSRLLAPGRIITTPEEAEAVGLTADAARMRLAAEDATCPRNECRTHHPERPDLRWPDAP